jgi:hypothetical protein
MSDSERKTIKINPELFSLKSHDRRKTKRNDKNNKHDNRIHPKGLSKIIKPNKMKKELLKRIKEHQLKEQKKREMEKEKRELDTQKNIQSFESEFNKSMNYLQKLINEKKKNAQLKKTFKNHSSSPDTETKVGGGTETSQPRSSSSNVHLKLKNYKHGLNTNTNTNTNTNKIFISSANTPSYENIIPDKENGNIHNSLDKININKTVNVDANVNNTIKDTYTAPSSSLASTSPMNGGTKSKSKPLILKPKLDLSPLTLTNASATPNAHNTHNTLNAPNAPNAPITANSQPPPTQNVPSFSQLQAKKEPPYGCLKGGNKPTFSQYQKTIKYKKDFENTIQKIPFIKKPTFMIDEGILERKQKLQKLRALKEKEHHSHLHSHSKIQILSNTSPSFSRSHDPNTNTNTTQISTPPTLSRPITPASKRYKRYKIRTIKKTYKLGKNNKTRSVGVFIKNNQTRKKIKHETELLHQIPITKIRKYLKNKNLLKVGSNAPEHVLRQTFTQSILTGDINNKNNDVLVHNYLNDK